MATANEVVEIIAKARAVAKANRDLEPVVRAIAEATGLSGGDPAPVTAKADAMEAAAVDADAFADELASLITIA